MQLEDIPKGQRYEYSSVCDVCNMTTTVYTQRADFQEYDTDVYVSCNCGNLLHFELPVN